MKRILTSFALVAASVAFAQVSIAPKEVKPEATLDVRAIGDKTTADGILIPRVDRAKAQSMLNVKNSTLIYVDDVATGDQSGKASQIDTKGFYYFDTELNSGEWVKVNSSPTFVKSIREDNRKSVVVDQLENGSPTPTKDYYIIMTGEPTGLALPAPNKSKGRTICTYNPGNSVVTVTPDPKGPVQSVDASQVVCFISDGKGWFNSSGY